MPAYRINGRNVLFLHVPKTGGTTIERFLGAHSATSLHNGGIKLLRPVRGSLMFFALPMQHFHGALIESMFGPGFFDYAFMVVRDPIERMKSEYRHSRVLWRPDAYMPFSPWIALALGLTHLTPNLRNNHFRRQVDFRCFGAEVFRFEDGMATILARLAERLDLPKPQEVPHMKRTENRGMEVSPGCAARIRRHFAADYEAFGY